MGLQMTTIDKNATMFCKVTTALLLWISLIFSNKFILIFIGVILLLSALLKIKKAPLVVLYNVSFGLFIKKKIGVVNVKSIRFSHIIATIFIVLTLVLMYFNLNLISHIVLTIFTLLQTTAIFGYCSAQKLYECLILNQNCCGLGKKVKGDSCNVR
ncbi:DUF4395 family protein [Mycoplasmatota bacterium WC44]